jgi:hypothetical protein
VTDWLSLYIQPEFAGTVSGTTGDQSNNFVQLRDAYTDIFMPVPFLFFEEKDFRIRAGLSKIPFGFEISSPVNSGLPSTEPTGSTARRMAIATSESSSITRRVRPENYSAG